MCRPLLGLPFMARTYRSVRQLAGSIFGRRTDLRKEHNSYARPERWALKSLIRNIYGDLARCARFFRVCSLAGVRSDRERIELGARDVREPLAVLRNWPISPVGAADNLPPPLGRQRPHPSSMENEHATQRISRNGRRALKGLPWTPVLSG